MFECKSSKGERVWKVEKKFIHDGKISMEVVEWESEIRSELERPKCEVTVTFDDS